MPSPAQRRTDRVSLTLLLEASGRDNHGQEFKEPSRTALINRSGGMIVIRRELTPSQTIHLQRRSPTEAHRHADVRIVGELGRLEDGNLYGVEILDPATDLWGVEFPPIADGAEAMARMLVECTYCHSREVVHLTELELRAFETNRGIARYCKACSVPSIWIQAAHEDEKKLSGKGRGRRVAEAVRPAPDSGEQRDRRRLRLQTRLTTCIRQPGFDDELAVCEDISPVGLCFRSKRRYDANARIDVAVPYSPQAANIFLPARIVYSEEIPKAGLFRHGAEYRRTANKTE
jgi:PilZ domain